MEEIAARLSTISLVIEEIGCTQGELKYWALVFVATAAAALACSSHPCPSETPKYS